MYGRQDNYRTVQVNKWTSPRWTCLACPSKNKGVKVMKQSISIKTHDGEIVVTSREVAANFEKEHKNVIRSIEGLMTEIKPAQNCAGYFIGTEYKDSKGEMRKEYLLTRDGFTLLAMGFTGAKAIEWKLKYIDAFNNMEQALRNSRKMLSPKEQLKLQLQILEEQDRKIEDVKEKVISLEDNMPLFNVECKELQALVRKIGIRVLGGKDAPAYKDHSLRGKVYSDIQHQLRREFGISRYEAIKRNQFETAKEIVSEYKVPLVLENEIETSNNQMKFMEG